MFCTPSTLLRIMRRTEFFISRYKTKTRKKKKKKTAADGFRKCNYMYCIYSQAGCHMTYIITIVIYFLNKIWIFCCACKKDQFTCKINRKFQNTPTFATRSSINMHTYAKCSRFLFNIYIMS